MRLARGSTEVRAAAIVFVACLGIGIIQGEKPFYFDSGGYWALSKTYVAAGHFSLFSFEYTGLRGYALPLLYLLLSDGLGGILGPDWLQVLVFNSALFALIGAVLAPRLARAAWPDFEWGLVRRLVLSAILVGFWSGYLNYPLSDLPALAAAMVAVIGVASGSRGWLLAAGLAAGFATNARPAYLLLIPLLLAVIAWDLTRGSKRGEGLRTARLLGAGLFLVGVAVLTVPQSLVQHHSLGGYSPIPGGGDLASLQYTEGLKLDRYETYIGRPQWAMMKYDDPDTGGIVSELENGVIRNTSQYAQVVVEHPVTMAGLFLRHLVDGLDQRYTTPYVEELEPPSRHLLRLAGFLLAFGALLRLVWPAARRSLGGSRWRYPAVLLLASLTSVASAMEPRFMLPVFVLILLLCLQPGWPSPLPRGGGGFARYRTAAAIAATAAIFLVAVGVIVHEATQNLTLVPLPTPANPGR